MAAGDAVIEPNSEEKEYMLSPPPHVETLEANAKRKAILQREDDFSISTKKNLQSRFSLDGPIYRLDL